VVAGDGGEEFVIILPETDAKGAYSVAEKLRNLLELHEFYLSDGKSIHVTASFGVSSLNMFPQEIVDKSRQIIKLADDALYMAKERGRNRVILFSEQQPQTHYKQDI